MGRFMKYAVEITSGGMIFTYLQSLMMIGSGIRVIIKDIISTREEFMMYANEMASGA
jgi:hypothetical protein